VAYAASAETAECRQCCAFCDRVLLPSGCIESGCQYLYLYDDENTGRRFMGCLNKVFKVEIDVELFREAERTRAGFGTVRMARAPLALCAFEIERAHEGAGDERGCVNPRFSDWPDLGKGAIRAFDLRDRCG
jgi:hypothetical protein